MHNKCLLQNVCRKRVQSAPSSLEMRISDKRNVSRWGCLHHEPGCSRNLSMRASIFEGAGCVVCVVGMHEPWTLAGHQTQETLNQMLNGAAKANMFCLPLAATHMIAPVRTRETLTRMLTRSVRLLLQLLTRGHQSSGCAKGLSPNQQKRRVHVPSGSPSHVVAIERKTKRAWQRTLVRTRAASRQSMLCKSRPER